MEMIGRNASAVSETVHREEYVILLTLKYVTAVSEKSLKKDWKSGHWDGLFASHVSAPVWPRCELVWCSHVLCVRAQQLNSVGSRRVWWNQGLISVFLYHFYCSNM